MSSSEGKKNKKPQSLVTDEGVRKALQKKEGVDVELKQWEVKDFTKMGDNYASVVSSVIVNYIKNNKEEKTTFIVKLNPLRKLLEGEKTNNFFIKEAQFYTVILPKLNSILKEINEPALKVPHFYYANLELNSEALYFGDLRLEGFKMADRRKGLDFHHLTLLLQELARMHAASTIFQGSKSKEEMLKEFPCLGEGIFKDEIMNDPEMIQWSTSVTSTAAIMFNKINDYAKYADQIRAMNFYNEIKEEACTSMPPFEVISHGDCWTNNFLFKYV